MGSEEPVENHTGEEAAVDSMASSSGPGVDVKSGNSDGEREEQRKLRRLQLMMDMVMCVIGQDHRLTVDEAAEMIADSKKAALAMFPEKELAYNLIYKPRLQRLMRERFRIQ